MHYTDWRRIIRLALASGMLIPSAPAAELPALAAHVLRIEDLLAVQAVSRVDLSPDARQVLIVMQGADLKANAPSLKVYLAQTRPGADLSPLPPEAAQAQWQTDAQALTFLKPAGECTQIWHVPTATRQPVQVGTFCLPSKDRMLTGYRWSADGRYLAYLAQPVAKDPVAAWSAKAVAAPEQEHAQPCIDLDSDAARAKGMDALDLACTGTSVGTGWMWGPEVASPALRFFSATQAQLPPTELRVFESATGATHRVSAEGSDVRQFDWSSKGHQLIWFSVARNEKKDENAPYLTGAGSSMSFGGEGSIVWADAGNESDTSRTLDAGTFTAIDLLGLGLKASPDGRHVALGTYQSVRVFAVPTTVTAKPKELFKGRAIQFDWSADSRSLYLLRYEHHVQSLVLVDAASGSMRSATNDPRWHGKPSFSADHRTFALSVEDVTEPSRVYIGHSGSSDLREIAGHQKLNPHWAQVAPLTTGRIDWRSWDDKWDLYGVTVAPREPAPKTRRPMVVVILGAGFPTQRQFGIDSQQPVLLLAAAGYTVFIPNDRSRAGITPLGYNELGAEHTYFSKTWRDAMQGVDLMIAKGLADADRIGIMGYSYGGGLVGWGITHTTRFKAAILKEPVSLDMAASWRNVWGHKNYGGDVMGKQFGIDNPYEGDGARFIQYESPITNVSAVRAPTLLEFGVKSGNVQAGGNEYYQALVWYGVPAELVMYPRTIHGFMEPVLLADSFRRELKWLGQWLKP